MDETTLTPTFYTASSEYNGYINPFISDQTTSAVLRSGSLFSRLRTGKSDRQLKSFRVLPFGSTFHVFSLHSSLSFFNPSSTSPFPLLGSHFPSSVPLTSLILSHWKYWFHMMQYRDRNKDQLQKPEASKAAKRHEAITKDRETSWESFQWKYALDSCCRGEA